mgnify:CR=1 FL=1
MKLIGSSIEKEYVDELRNSSSALFLNKRSHVLLESIRKSFHGVFSACILDCIPEQGEDIYTVLVDGAWVAEFEIPGGTEKLVEARNIRSVESYRRGLRKQRHLKLLVAMDLILKGELRVPFRS